MTAPRRAAQGIVSAPAARRSGFTLIEMLLVLALIGILTAVTMPNFVRSLRGNRLRTAVRSVVMAGRYTRSMAVLQQKELVLAFNLDEGSLKVEHIVVAVPTGDAPAPVNEDPETAEADAPVYGFATRTELLRRRLDQVAIRAVEVEDKEVTSGSALIIYSNNGRCTPYVVTLQDAQGGSVKITVDALSSARTENTGS